MLRTIYFIIARNWKQPKCLPVSNWVNCGISISWTPTQQYEEE